MGDYCYFGGAGLGELWVELHCHLGAELLEVCAHRGSSVVFVGCVVLLVALLVDDGGRSLYTLPRTSLVLLELLLATQIRCFAIELADYDRPVNGRLALFPEMLLLEALFPVLCRWQVEQVFCALLVNFFEFVLGQSCSLRVVRGKLRCLSLREHYLWHISNKEAFYR